MFYSPNKYRETEGIKVRAVGIAVDQATLQELAHKLGIEQKVNTMTRAQKTELAYLQIMERTVKMQGDLSRTVEILRAA